MATPLAVKPRVTGPVERKDLWHLVYVLLIVAGILSLFAIADRTPGPSNYKTFCVGHTMVISGVNSVAAVPASTDCPSGK